MSAIRFAVTTVIVSLASLPAWGQAYLQQGNALDANNRLNSGGLNYGGRVYSPNLTNRIVTGNAAGGASFRGYSGVQDSSSLFIRNYATANTSSSGLTSGLGLSSLANNGVLPSDALYGFRRDSFSSANVQQGQLGPVLGRLPYYSSSSTVANTGAIVAGLNKVGSSQLATPYSSPRASLINTPTNPLGTTGTGEGGANSLSSRLVRIDNGQPLTGQVNQRLLGSALFGAVRQVPVDALVDQTRTGSGRPPMANPLDRPKDVDQTKRDKGSLTGKPSDTTQNNNNQKNNNLTNPLDKNQPPDQANPADRDVNTASLVHKSDLRQPIGGSKRTSTLADRLGAAGRTPDMTGRTAVGLGMTDEELAGPIRTFVGTQASIVNQRMSEAEDLLKRGQYYRAADTYEAATSFDPKNPLPVLGKAVALLGAGDYVSSANYLFTGIQLYEVMPRLHVDLKSLITDTTVLENRRADLEKRLQVIDDFRLRFLLGYVEYSTGREEAGLANMERASEKAPPAMTQVKHFVEALHNRQKIAPPATRPSPG